GHLAEALRFYFEFHQLDGYGYVAHIHDPVVLATALEWARAPWWPPGCGTVLVPDGAERRRCGTHRNPHTWTDSGRLASPVGQASQCRAHSQHRRRELPRSSGRIPDEGTTV